MVHRLDFYRRVVWLLGCAIACLTGCDNRPAPTAQPHVLRGQEYLDAARYREAATEFRNALQIGPEEAAVHVKLGMALLGLQDSRGASSEFRRALVLDDTMREPRLELSRLYLAERNGRKAEEEARILIERDPRDIDAHLVRATRYLQERQLQEAREVINQVLALDPKSAAVHLTLGRLLVLEGKHETAEKEMEQAITLEPSRLEGYITLADYQRQRGNLTAAESTLKQATAAVPNSSVPRFELGELYLLQDRNDDARALFEGMSKDGPDAWTARKRLADLFFDLGKTGKAQRLVYDLLASDSTDLETDYLHARLLLTKGDIAGGSQQLEHVLSEWPSFARARYQLALARVRENKLESAVAELNLCLKHQPDFIRARSVLARLHLQAQHYDLAEEEATRVLAVLPQDFDMRLLMTDTAFSRGDRGGSRQIAQQLTSDFPDRFESHYRLGRALDSLGRYSEAEAPLERAIELSPTSVQVLAELVQVVKAAKRPDADIIKRVEKHVEAHPDLALAKLLLGHLKISSGDVDGGTAILESAVREHPNLLPAYYILGGVYAKQGKLVEARKHFEQLLAKDPTVVAACMMLGVIETADGHPDEALKWYKQALELDPHFAPAANNLAWHYAENVGDLDKALELARLARAAGPDDPYIADTLGWILYRRGLYAAAIDQLKESAARLPDNAEVRHHLGMAYLRSGDTASARSQLGIAAEMDAFLSVGKDPHALGGRPPIGSPK